MNDDIQVTMTKTNHEIVFHIQYHPTAIDLARVYTVDYFKKVGLEPEIYLHDTDTDFEQTGGQDPEKMTIPYRYFVYLIEKNPLRNVNFSRVPTSPPTPALLSNSNQVSFYKRIQNYFKINREDKYVPLPEPVPTAPVPVPMTLEPVPTVPVMSSMVLKFKKEPENEFNEEDGKSMYEISQQRIRTVPLDIRLTKDGLYYHEIEEMVRIENYTGYPVNLQSVYTINGKLIAIYDGKPGFPLWDEPRFELTKIPKM